MNRLKLILKSLPASAFIVLVTVTCSGLVFAIRHDMHPGESDVSRLNLRCRVRTNVARRVLFNRKGVKMSEDRCTYCHKSLTRSYSFSYGVPGFPQIFACKRRWCIIKRWVARRVPKIAVTITWPKKVR